MPTLTPIQNQLIDSKPKEAPIPIRQVNTRLQRIEPKVDAKIAGQPNINIEASAESPAPKESISTQVSAMARKEQAYRQREIALKERERAIEEKLKNAEKFESLKAKFSAKDFSEAEELGLSYEDYTKYVLDKQGGENPQDLKIKELEAKIDSLTKGTEESNQSQYEETISEYKKEISKLVASSPEYSSIKELGHEEAVLNLIVDAFEEDNEELTVDEAARQVEEYLVDFGKKFANLPKFAKAPEPSEEPDQAPPERRALPEPTMGTPSVGKTLTNDMTLSSEKRPYKSLQFLSEPERYAEARRRVLERQAKTQSQ